MTNLFNSDLKLPILRTFAKNRPVEGKTEVFPRASLCTMAMMAVTVEMQNTGDSGSRTEIVAVIEHVLGERPGNWQVSIVGSRENKDWEMKIEGPNGFQRLYTCGPDQHEPEIIRQLVSKLLPAQLL